MTFNRDLPLKDMMRPVPADPGAVEGDSFRLNIDMLIKIVLRRLWLLAIVVGAVLMLAIYGLSKTTPQYVAGAELLLGEPASGAPLGDILAERVLNSQAVERELAILKSNRLLAQVVLALELDKDPEFNAALRPETPAEKFVRELKGTIKSFITPPPEPGPAPSAQVEAAAGAEQDRLQGLGGTIASLKGRLRIRQLGDSYLVRVTMVSANRKKAAAIANTVVDQYIAQIVEDRRIQAERFASWLDRRLTTIEKEVEAAENDVLEFRASVITGSDSAERLNQQMRELTTKLISARSELLATEARYTKLQQIHDDQGPLAAADVLDAPVIANYRATIAELKREEADVIRRFGENASQLITLRQSIDSLNKDIAREVVRVLAEIGNSAEISRAVVDSLENSLTNIERLTVERAREQIELRQLDRVAEASRLVYERFFDSYRKQQEVQNFEDTNAAVISYASPPFAPSTPKVLLTLVLATAAGGMLGLGIIVLLELRRRTVKTADDEALMLRPFVTLTPLP
ncbi:MAG: GumC family protein, partial [Pseudomonadota bacterium]